MWGDFVFAVAFDYLPPAGLKFTEANFHFFATNINSTDRFILKIDKLAFSQRLLGNSQLIKGLCRYGKNSRVVFNFCVVIFWLFGRLVGIPDKECLLALVPVECDLHERRV